MAQVGGLVHGSNRVFSILLLFSERDGGVGAARDFAVFPDTQEVCRFLKKQRGNADMSEIWWGNTGPWGIR